MLRSLRVRGPYRGTSGYDRHVRSMTRELVRQGVRVQLVDVPEWNPVTLPASAVDPFFEQLSRPVDAEFTVHVVMPTQVDINHATVPVNFTAFEATRVPRKWIEHNRQHALVVVPTESSRDSWEASGFTAERIRVCPLGVDPQLYGNDVAPLKRSTESGRLVSAFRTRFLNVSELGPRKNIVGLLHAWLLATRRDDDAILILKLGQYTPGWLRLLKRRIRRLESQIGRVLEDAAPVELMLEVLPDAAMPCLFAAATHYISMSHGEGWDLVMTEAAASGLRLIAPDHSAYRAYLNDDIATLIPSRKVPARFDGDPKLQALFAGAEWWEPDVNAAVMAIRSAIDAPDDAPSPAREVILDNFTWERSTTRLIEILSAR